MKKLTWEELEPVVSRASVMDVGQNLDWLKLAWEIIQDTPLCEYSDRRSYTEVMMRFLCICEIVHIYKHISGFTIFEYFEIMEEWLIQTEIDKIEVVLLAGEQYFADYFIVEPGAVNEVIDVVHDRYHESVVRWLIRGFGGNFEMFEALNGSNQANTCMAAANLHIWIKDNFSRSRSYLDAFYG